MASTKFDERIYEAGINEQKQKKRELLKELLENQKKINIHIQHIEEFIKKGYETLEILKKQPEILNDNEIFEELIKMISEFNEIVDNYAFVMKSNNFLKNILKQEEIFQLLQNLLKLHNLKYNDSKKITSISERMSGNFNTFINMNFEKLSSNIQSEIALFYNLIKDEKIITNKNLQNIGHILYIKNLININLITKKQGGINKEKLKKIKQEIDKNFNYYLNNPKEFEEIINNIDFAELELDTLENNIFNLVNNVENLEKKSEINEITKLIQKIKEVGGKINNLIKKVNSLKKQNLK